MINLKKAREAVQIATYKVRVLYLGDLAGDEIAVASTAVPEHLRELESALHTANEMLSEGPTPWGEQAVEWHTEGVYRLKQRPNCVPAD